MAARGLSAVTSILFYGDPHGEWDPLVDECLYGDRPAAVVVLGDMDLKQPFERVVAAVLELGIALYMVITT